MRTVPLGIRLTLALLCICFEAAPQNRRITVTGVLIRAMAIGGESTGWRIQLEYEVSLGSKQVDSIEVDSHDRQQLEKLEKKRISATGQLSRRNGVETGDR